MSRRWIWMLMVCGAVLGWTPEPVIAGKGQGRGKAAPVPVLSQAAIDDLLFLREEEKLAHDVYIMLHAEWGRRVFRNISQSEQRHTAAVLKLLEKYGLDDPARKTVGQFRDPELQGLYDKLLADGLSSPLAALKVGAMIEEVDLNDIMLSMERTDQPDILQVYASLLAGSERHLNAFVRNIERMTGKTYEAQYLTQDEVDLILGR